MSTIYVNIRQSEEQRIVIVDKDGVLSGYEQDVVGWENKKGDIYKAVVSRIEDGLDAAFVDFGESKNGFLPLKHVGPHVGGSNGAKLAEGDSILVQVKKDHVGDKGAGMTANISLAGCYLVLMPNHKQEKVLMSRNVAARDRQKTTEAIAGLNLPEGMGVIVRTAGIGRSAEDLRWDLESYLLKLWGAVSEAAENCTGPALIYRENNLILRAVRDYYKPGEDEIYCDDEDSYRELKSFMEIISPENAECVHYHDGEGMVPDTVEEQIDAIYRREIKTSSGARVVFDSTEAMVAIDINSAQMRGHSDIEATALRANMEAAEIIARHLCLRDLSGLVVVDFIDMLSDKNRHALEEHFVTLLRKDRARVQWAPISRFGLMELSRQRLSRPVEEAQGVVCKTCHGTGRQRRPESFALRLLRQIRVHLRNFDKDALIVQAPAMSAVYLLNEKRAEISELEKTHNCEILIAPSEDMHPPDVIIRKVDNQAGASYRITERQKNAAEEMQKRLERKGAKRPEALVKTVMPEERPAEGFLAKLWKTMFGGTTSDNRSRVQTRKNVRPSAMADGDKTRKPRRRRPRRGKGETTNGEAKAQSRPPQNNGRAKSAESQRSNRRPSAGAATNVPKKSAESSKPTPPVKPAEFSGATKSDESVKSSESVKPAEITEVAKPVESMEVAKPVESVEIAKPAESAEIAKPVAQEPEKVKSPAPVETFVQRLAKQYSVGQYAMRVALTAIGRDAEEDGEITPEITAELDGYFNQMRQGVSDEPLKMVETGTDDNGMQKELITEVRELEASDYSSPSAPSTSAESPIRQVETTDKV